MADEIRALTVKSPWASAITYGPKRVENRTWPTGFRGILAIHAGRAVDWQARPTAWLAAGLAPYTGGPRKAWRSSLPLGAVIAVAELRGCHGPDACWGTCSPWAVNGQHHWNLFDVRPLPEPVPCRGMLGLWRLPEDAEAAVRKQLEASRG